MIGAICGDILGSHYEAFGVKTKDVDLFKYGTFTDDTVMSVAVSQALLLNTSYKEEMIKLGRFYPLAGYGGMFYRWLHEEESTPYGSYGNGSAMRVSPIAWMIDSEEKVLEEARKCAEVSHNHPEGIKGAQASALAVYMANKGASKDEIRARIEEAFNYNLDRKLDDIQPGYKFDVTCQGSVPEAIICFLDSCDYEDTIRNVISLGGDADTQGAVAGSIAEAYYKHIPEEILNHCYDKLNLHLLRLISEFTEKYNKKMDKLVKYKIDEIYSTGKDDFEELELTD